MSAQPIWIADLRRALAVRSPLIAASGTNIFRLVHDVGDGFSGLFIDNYAGHIRMEAQDPRWEQDWAAFACTFSPVFSCNSSGPQMALLNNAKRFAAK